MNNKKQKQLKLIEKAAKGSDRKLEVGNLAKALGYGPGTELIELIETSDQLTTTERRGLVLVETTGDQ